MSQAYKNMTYNKPSQPAFIRDMLSGRSAASNGGREPIPERPVEDDYQDPESDEGEDGPVVVQVRKRDLSEAEVKRCVLSAFHMGKADIVTVKDGEKTPPPEPVEPKADAEAEEPKAEKEKSTATAGARVPKRKIIITEGEEPDMQPAKKVKETLKEKKKKQKKQKGLLSFEE